MTVDYAAKRRERMDAGWALRNFKLRLSRKLIFTAGLSMCMSCALRPSSPLSMARTQLDFDHALSDFLIELANRPPLEVLAAFALSFGAVDHASQILDSYESFLEILGNPTSRERLESLDVDTARGDELFAKTRHIGTAFQDGLTGLFFATDPELTRTTQRYGVF